MLRQAGRGWRPVVGGRSAELRAMEGGAAGGAAGETGAVGRGAAAVAAGDAEG